jgi:hypothetical protein
MAEDDQEWIEGDVRRSSFGGFTIGSKKKKPKRRAADKPVPRKPKGDGGGSGAPLGRSPIRD